MRSDRLFLSARLMNEARRASICGGFVAKGGVCAKRISKEAAVKAGWVWSGKSWSSSLQRALPASCGALIEPFCSRLLCKCVLRRRQHPPPPR